MSNGVIIRGIFGAGLDLAEFSDRGCGFFLGVLEIRVLGA